MLYTAGVSCSFDLLHSTLSKELSHEFAVDLRCPAKVLHVLADKLSCVTKQQSFHGS